MAARPRDVWTRFIGASSPPSLPPGGLAARGDMWWYTETELVTVGPSADGGAGKVGGCGPSCTQRHDSDGPCLVCGQGWGPHRDHTCPPGGGGGRGAWSVAIIVNSANRRTHLGADGKTHYCGFQVRPGGAGVEFAEPRGVALQQALRLRAW